VIHKIQEQQAAESIQNTGCVNRIGGNIYEAIFQQERLLKSSQTIKKVSGYNETCYLLSYDSLLLLFSWWVVKDSNLLRF
jgi:hypothetical protein